MVFLAAKSQTLIPSDPLELTSTPWLVIHTRSRHEKKVAKHLADRAIPSLVPIYRSVRRWKDRRKELDMPLFPGYCFVQADLTQHLRILQVPGVVNFVTFQGRPAPVGELEMEAIRRGNGLNLQPHPYLRVGRRVRVQHGSMSGVEGFFVRWKDRTRVVISISLIQRSVAVEIDEADVMALL
jgi:transcription antitermination factor NusG